MSDSTNNAGPGAGETSHQAGGSPDVKAESGNATPTPDPVLEAIDWKQKWTTSTKYTTEERKDLFLILLEANMGNISKSCRMLDMHRRTYYQWVKNDPDFADACEDIQEGLIDIAESKLHENILDNQNQAIIFFLKTKGKDRGYVERRELSGPDGKPLELIRNITINLNVLSVSELEQLRVIAEKLRGEEQVELHVHEEYPPELSLRD